ncbi:hypothetical protein TARUN_6137 [Trichoderma arundinaceum]|uniref:Uncharacterized protein n=1 Tax=Trichoderma arundinaceum TaxID=490622 RepID=A0A395NJ56_TRIAR|nr:hypothetical protein TARUN_6137 [Trichoderma arundinaceum]
MPLAEMSQSRSPGGLSAGDAPCVVQALHSSSNQRGRMGFCAAEPKPLARNSTATKQPHLVLPALPYPYLRPRTPSLQPAVARPASFPSSPCRPLRIPVVQSTYAWHYAAAAIRVLVPVCARHLRGKEAGHRELPELRFSPSSESLARPSVVLAAAPLLVPSSFPCGPLLMDMDLRAISVTAGTRRRTVRSPWSCVPDVLFGLGCRQPVFLYLLGASITLPTRPNNSTNSSSVGRLCSQQDRVTMPLCVDADPLDIQLYDSQSLRAYG